MSQIYEENTLRPLPPRQRLDVCTKILKSNETDTSLRAETVWVTGEITREISHSDPMYNEIVELLCWVLQNDDNAIVKHEACFQIADSKAKMKAPLLVDAFLNDPSPLVRHEAIEALGLLRGFEFKDDLLKALNDKNKDVRDTAALMLRRFERLNKGH